MRGCREPALLGLAGGGWPSGARRDDACGDVGGLARLPLRAHVASLPRRKAADRVERTCVHARDVPRAPERAREVLHLERGLDDVTRRDEQIGPNENALGAMTHTAHRDDPSGDAAQWRDTTRERLLERRGVPRFRRE